MTFKRQEYTDKQRKAYWTNAKKDLARALRYNDPDVSFRFSYDALIKLAITISAWDGIRVMSRAGHHIELLEYISSRLNNERISLAGNRMRMKRNKDLYSGGVSITEKEAREYALFIRKIFLLAEKYFDAKLGKSKLL